MLKRRWFMVTFIAVLLIVLGLFSFFLLHEMKQHKQQMPETISPTSFQSPDEKALWGFLRHWMMQSNGGVYTNLHPTRQTKESPTAGHTILSESVGLMLNYAVDADDQPLFDCEKKLLKDKFMKDSVIQWVIPMPTRSPINSSVDDLRIIGALLNGARQFNEPSSEQLAFQLAKNLYSTNVINGFMVDDNTEKQTLSNATVSLPYADIQTIKMLDGTLPEYDILYQNERRILSKSLLSSGFYACQYLLKENQFLLNDTGKPMLDTNMAEQLITAMHAEQAGVPTEPFANRLETLMSHNGDRIFTRINQTGSFDSKDESPAVYALAARYFSDMNDNKYAQICLTRLHAMKVTTGQYAGGFVDLSARQAFSFDQLQALIAYRGAKQ